MEDLRKHLEDIELVTREQVKHDIETYLKNNSTCSGIKVVCDNTNNLNDKFINVDVYYKEAWSTHYIVNNITIKRDKIKEVRKQRKKKLNTLYDSR